MRRIALLLAVAMAVAVPVAADDHEEWEPNLVHERVYVVCEGEKVQNIEQLDGNTPTWDTEEPDESVTEGAGCGSVDAPFTQTDAGNVYDTTWAGFFEGNLDTLTVHAHNIYVGPGRATGEFEVAVKLFINGRPYFPDVGGHVIAEAQPSDTRLSELVEFTITDLGLVEEDDDRLHYVELVLHGGTPHHRDPTVTDTVSGWVWGTTEVPSGITFNPDEPVDAVLPAD